MSVYTISIMIYASGSSRYSFLAQAIHRRDHELVNSLLSRSDLLIITRPKQRIVWVAVNGWWDVRILNRDIIKYTQHVIKELLLTDSDPAIELPCGTFAWHSRGTFVTSPVYWPAGRLRVNHDVMVASFVRSKFRINPRRTSPWSHCPVASEETFSACIRGISSACHGLAEASDGSS